MYDAVVSPDVEPAHALPFGRYVEESLSYPAYIALVDRLLAENRTTGPNQSPALVEYTRLNRQRMRRIEQQTVLEPGVAEVLRGSTATETWLILTEAWCGDAAQNIPIIDRMARETRGITTRYLLRDEHPELMDRFLTKGTRSIPKLIALGAGTWEVRWTWGPRPRVAMELFAALKAQGIEKPAILEQIHRWYLQDGGRSLQQELKGTGTFLRNA